MFDIVQRQFQGTRPILVLKNYLFCKWSTPQIWHVSNITEIHRNDSTKEKKKIGSHKAYKAIENLQL